MSARRGSPPPGMTRQGVRDLSVSSGQRLSRNEAPGPSVVVVEDSAGPLSDLLYCHIGEVRQEIMATWPEAQLESDYDDIHEYRTVVDIPLCTRFDWYKFLVRAGAARISLAFQMSLRLEPTLIEAVLDAEMPGWRQRAGRDHGRRGNGA